MSETSHLNPMGSQSHPVESGQQPEASLAWVVRRPTAKRRQRWCLTMSLSPEISIAGVRAFSHAKDRGVASQWPDANGPAGVARTWGASTGVLQEQERSDVSTGRIGLGVVPNQKRPGHRLRTAGRMEQTDAVQPVVSPNETNEFGEMDVQKSECLHSTEIRSAVCRPSGPRGAN